MKKLSIITSMAFLVCVMFACQKEKHFITDAKYRTMVEKRFDATKKLANNRSEALFSVFNQNLSLEEKEALQFLYAFMSLSDLADYNGDFYLKQVRSAFAARDTFAWGKKVPEDIFRHFVLPPRVNNENMDTARMAFFGELKDRIKNMSMYDAALEVNVWCNEKVAYKASDGRTSSPLATCKSAIGRCGEESTFTVTAMRAVGIPARQIYTPRWAHCDDNHAWVEVWVDGKWYFLGACEPSPKLNMGWFAIPSTRTMLTQTNVYGKYESSEEVLVENDLFTRINLLHNYAPTKRLFVKVLDANNQVVENANVEFQLYNYSEFYPLATKKTDKNGYCSLNTGLGDLLIWANKGNTFGFEKADMRLIDTLKIVLNKNANQSYELSLNFTPPVPGTTGENVDSAQIKQCNARIKKCNAIREAYEHTFMDEAKAKAFAQQYNYNIDSTVSILVKSRGNHEEIKKFMSSVSANLKPYVLSLLLDGIYEKDLRDTKAEYLFDHLNNAVINPQYDLETLAKYVINPRVQLEMVKPYKAYFQSKFGKNTFTNPQAVAEWIKKNININDDANAGSRCQLTPVGVYELKVSDKRSRDIFFVALCRSFGFPARMDLASLVPQYLDNGKWTDVKFETENTAIAPKGKLVISSDKKSAIAKPEYYIHYTIERFNDGKYRSLDYEYDNSLQKLPATLEVDAGNYLMVTGNRAADGSVFTQLKFFTLGAQETKDMPVFVREAILERKVEGQLDMAQKLQVLNQAKEVKLSDLISKKGTILMWIEPNKEPTRHVVVEMQNLKKEMEAWGGTITMILKPEYVSMFNPKSFENLPKQTRFYVDSQHIFDQVQAQLKDKLQGGMPVVIAVSDKGEIFFHSAGYRIGLPEQLMKLF